MSPRRRRDLIGLEPMHSFMLIGPTQSAKSSALVIPALLEHDGPAVVTSVKTDLVQTCAGARQARGAVWIFDPANQAGMGCARWSPLRRAVTPAGAAQAAVAYVEAAAVGSRESTWTDAAGQLLGPLMHAAATGGWDMGDVLRWTQDPKALAEPLTQLDLQGQPALAGRVRAVLNRDPRIRDSVLFTASNALAAYADPQVLEVAGGCDWTPELLLSGSNTLFLVGAASQQRRLAPVYAAILSELREAAFTAAAARFAATGRYLPEGFRRLLWVADEAANAAPVKDLAGFASTAGGQGVTLLTVFHDLAQLREVYGRDGADTIFSSHVAKLLLPGVTDQQTLDAFSAVIGKERVVETSRTSGRDVPSTTESGRERAVLGHRQARELPPLTGVLLYGARPPARVRLRPWFEDPALVGMVRPFMGGWSPPSRSGVAESGPVAGPPPGLGLLVFESAAGKSAADESAGDESAADESAGRESAAHESAVPLSVVSAAVADGTAQRMGDDAGQPVLWHGTWWTHRPPDTMVAVVDPAAIARLQVCLARWQAAA